MKINRTDSRLVARLKLIYLLPVSLVMAIPVAIWIGMEEIDLRGEIVLVWNHTPEGHK